MAVRLRFKVECAISSTSAEDRDLGNLRTEVVVDSQGEGGSRKFNLAGGDTDVPINLGNITIARFLLVRAVPTAQVDPFSNIKLKLNSLSGEELIISAMAPSREGYLLLTVSGVTALYATNTGTTAMSLTVCVAGD